MAVWDSQVVLSLTLPQGILTRVPHSASLSCIGFEYGGVRTSLPSLQLREIWGCFQFLPHHSQCQRDPPDSYLCLYPHIQVLLQDRCFQAKLLDQRWRHWNICYKIPTSTPLQWLAPAPCVLLADRDGSRQEEHSDESMSNTLGERGCVVFHSEGTLWIFCLHSAIYIHFKLSKCK